MAVDTEAQKYPPPVCKKQRKEAAILDAAAALFLEKGYEATTIEDVAQRAAVSKPTVYRYFSDKQALYAAFIRKQCERHQRQIFDANLTGTDIRVDLTRIARNYVDLIFSPPAMAMFRVSIAESQRFPALGRAFYDAGPSIAARRMGQFLAGAVARGSLRIDDIDAASFQFIELCKSELLFKVLFGVLSEIDEDTRQAQVNRTVTTFLAAYAA
jgi:AcrR family transcriptional regulator